MEKEWIEKHIDDMVQDICKLSEIPSVSVKTEDPDMPFGQACLDALHAALDLGRSMGFETFNHENYCHKASNCHVGSKHLQKQRSLWKHSQDTGPYSS